ncbi:Uncharacterised protein [Yersinia enterocolitica]|uniref:DUF6931 family protein n=1 Tax=Yersinia mollaretii TaxID=33060 RepID=UPI0005E1A9EE|nr:hypothetical protein [Yersinia mollaretii]CNK96827.1 Uncharacterised protein [Yersinia enterocolitica]
MTLHTLTSSDSSPWEETLRQWAQGFSPLALGIKLTTLLQDVTPASEKPLLEAIAQQYHQPADQCRWQIFAQAEALGFSTPIGALALSQFLSHGSMSPDELPPVYPDPQLTSQMLYCALVLFVTQLAESPVEGVRLLIDRSTALEVA